jgi:hypothetical protein
MRPCIWYHTRERQPSTSGYYLSYRGFGIAGPSDYDSATGYLYYDHQQNVWRDYESDSHGHDAIVYYWTEADPEEWVDGETVIGKRTVVPNAALDAAWADILLAIERYEIVKALTQ